MPEYKEIPPVYAINDYAFALLQKKLDWTKVDGKVPIIPASQQPEFTNYDKPFIVYGFAREPSPADLFVLNVQTAAYTVYSKTAFEINQATDMLGQAFSRYDESAMDVNHWIKVKSAQRDKFKGINFAWIEVTSAQGASEEAQEGGRQDGMLVIRYAYTVDIAPNEFRL